MNTKPSNARWILPLGALLLITFMMFGTGIAWEAAGPPLYFLAAIPLLILIGLTIWGLGTTLMGTPKPPTAQPGWYPDRNDPQIMRWHDGHTWTTRTQQRQH